MLHHSHGGECPLQQEIIRRHGGAVDLLPIRPQQTIVLQGILIPGDAGIFQPEL